MPPSVKVVALVSVGRHPLSGRARRAEQDSKAVELGLRLAADALEVVHAGNPQDAVLRQYAGMGLNSLTVLQQIPECDAIPALLSYVQASHASIVLTGVRAERGESSGMLPYLLAEKLAWPVLPRVAEILAIKDDEAEVLLALPRGQRRTLMVKLPFIASVDNAAAPARQSAFGLGLRAQLKVLEVDQSMDQAASLWQVNEAKPRPKRLKVVKAKSAADRMKAATAKPLASGGTVLKDSTPKEQAKAILDLLIEEKVIR